MNQNERRIYLIKYLLDERPEYRGAEIPGDSSGQKRLLRALMNVREPADISGEFLRIQDEYLREETSLKGITDADELTPVQPGIYLWQGDITTLRCDAIVNAANSGMTGCYFPNHRCIDNAIHTYAGIRLRLACADIMEEQGAPEPVGKAKITPAFDLPCRYILHTVGPMITGRVTERDRSLLASCYRSCLELAAEKDWRALLSAVSPPGNFISRINWARRSPLKR